VSKLSSPRSFWKWAVGVTCDLMEKQELVTDDGSMLWIYNPWTFTIPLEAQYLIFGPSLQYKLEKSWHTLMPSNANTSAHFVKPQIRELDYWSNAEMDQI
jgi:hypothetical protein